MDASNLTLGEICFYVVGERTTSKAKRSIVTVKITKVGGGWYQSVLVGDCPELSVKYVSNETRDDLNVWFVCDFKTRYRIFTSEEEALAHHAQKELHLPTSSAPNA